MKTSPRPSLQVGDRVRTARLLLLLPEGSVGTVRRIYRVRDLCAVDFDDWYGMRILPIHELVLVPQAPEAGKE